MFKSCKLSLNDKHYHVNAQRVVAEVTPDPLGFGQAYRLCDDAESEAVLAEVKRLRHNKARRSRDAAMRDLGMVKVRGALGGTYWE